MPRDEKIVDPLEQITLVRHWGEVDDGGCATPYRAQRMVGWTGVGCSGDQLAGTGLNVGDGMGMGLYPTGHDNLPGCVDDRGVFFW